MRAEHCYRLAVRTPWCAKRYADRAVHIRNGNIAKEAKLGEAFPPLFKDPQPIVETPAIIVDRHGIVLAWFLPEVLLAHRQVCRHLSHFCYPL